MTALLETRHICIHGIWTGSTYPLPPSTRFLRETRLEKVGRCRLWELFPLETCTNQKAALDPHCSQRGEQIKTPSSPAASLSTKFLTVSEQGPAPRLQRSSQSLFLSLLHSLSLTREAETHEKDFNGYTKISPKTTSHWELTTSLQEPEPRLAEPCADHSSHCSERAERSSQ